MTSNKTTALIIGASSGVGLALAGHLAEQGYQLHLVARGERDLESIAYHLSLSHAVSVTFSVLDLAELSNNKARDLVQTALKKMGQISRLFLVSGANSSKDELPMTGDVIKKMFYVNAVGPIHILNAVLESHKTAKLRSVTICSTIAASVPRRRNIVYASAKIALESFSLGSRHYLSSCKIPVQIYRLGYVATNLSFGQKTLFPAVEPGKIARILLKNSDRDIGLSYLPHYWFMIILILEYLPWSIYRKLSF